VIKNIYLFAKREGIFPLIVKIIDKFFIPFGISFLTFFNLKDSAIEKNPYLNDGYDKEKIFSKIYLNSFWKSKESRSGSGSDVDKLQNYSKNLNIFFNQYKINSMLDVPCGDFLFMNKFLKDKKINYKGGDIVKEIIENNKKKYGQYEFKKFDITKDLEKDYFDVLHVKDCLFHFSFNDIWKSLENIVKYNTKYTLITTHNSLLLKNLEIKTGDFRYLDLEKKPLYFPKPIYKIYEYKFDIKLFPRFVGVWKTKDLKSHFNK